MKLVQAKGAEEGSRYMAILRSGLSEGYFIHADEMNEERKYQFQTYFMRKYTNEELMGFAFFKYVELS